MPGLVRHRADVALPDGIDWSLLADIEDFIRTHVQDIQWIGAGVGHRDGQHQAKSLALLKDLPLHRVQWISFTLETFGEERPITAENPAISVSGVVWRKTWFPPQPHNRSSMIFQGREEQDVMDLAAAFEQMLGCRRR